MNKHSLRRIFSLLLAVMMVCTLLPTAAFAEEGVEQPVATDEQSGAVSDGKEAPKPETPPVEEKKEETSAEEKGGETTPAETLSLQSTVQSIVNTVDTQTAKTVTITVRVFVQSTGESYTVGTDTVDGGNPHQIQSAEYKIPPLTKFVSADRFGKVTGVYGDWYFPGTQGQQPGTIIYWSTNSSTGTMTYYVDWYKSEGGGTSSKLWNFTLKYDANGGTGAPADQTWGTDDKYIKSHDFAIPATVPTRDGYIFKGWSNTKDGAAAYQPGGKCRVMQTAGGYNGGSVTKTLYAVWEAEGPQKPNKPTKNEIDSALAQVPVKLYCTTQEEIVGEYSLGYNNAKYDVSEPQLNGDVYTCTLTVYAEAYVAAKNSSTHTPHDLKDEASKTITLTYGSKKWTASPDSVTFKVACALPTPSEPPYAVDLHDKFNVNVVCDKNPANHKAVPISAQPDSLTVGKVEGDADSGYTCTVTVTADTYVEIYNGYYPGADTHVLVSGEKSTRTFIMTWAAKDKKWTLPDDLDITFHVKCVPIYFVTYTDGVEDEVVFEDESYRVAMGAATPAFSGGTPTRDGYEFAGWDPEVSPTVTTIVTYTAQWKEKTPEKPTDEFLQGLPIGVVCTNDSRSHKNPSNEFSMIPGSYKIGDPEKDENGNYFCTITVYAEAYVNKFSADEKVAHTLADGEKDAKEFKLWHDNGNVWGLGRGGTAVFDVVCKTLYSYKAVHVYRTNGEEDGRSNPLTYPSVASGTVVSADSITKALTYNGNTYEYTGADPESAAIENNNVVFTLYYDRTVEMCTVTYTDGVDGEEVFADQVYTVEMGKPTPAFSGVPTRDGYKFTGWDPAVTDTVTETIVYTAKWEKLAPDAPTNEEVIELGPTVAVKCTTGHGDLTWTLRDSTFKVGKVKGDAVNGYTCTVTVEAIDYVEWFNSNKKANGVKHTLTSPDDATFELKYVDGKWTRPANPAVKFEVKCETETTYTVTYKDGADGKVFADDVHSGLKSGAKTPDYKDGTPVRDGYKFAGWDPQVDETVTKDAVYTAKWEKVETFTVTYTDGIKGKAFKDQVYSDLQSGVDTPAFSGKPTRKGYTFAGWTPKVASTVTKDVTYTATWKAVNTSGKDKLAKTGDNGLVLIFGGLMLLSMCGIAAVCVYDRKRKHS